MEVKDVVDAWKSGELTDCAAMCVVCDLVYPAHIDEEDIRWANKSVRDRIKDQAGHVK